MYYRYLVIILIGALLSNCTDAVKVDFLKAKKNADNGDFESAINVYDQVMKRDSEGELAIAAARESAQLAQYSIKDYKKAIEIKKFIILHSSIESERLQAQKDIASIYFENLQDYSSAIIAYNKLLLLSPPIEDVIKTKLLLARANLYQNDFYQAESELDSLLRLDIDTPTKFEALNTRGNIALTLKQNTKAIDIFKQLLRDHFELAISNNIPFTIAVCYEEMSDFKSAVGILELYKSKYPAKLDYIDLRIKRLKERQSNQPGARGLRK